MDRVTDHDHRFECVQPELGEQLWRLDTDDVAPDLWRRLERHLRVCDDCRLQRAVHDRLGSLGAAGGIDIEVEPECPLQLRVRRPGRFLAACGGLALAASLVLATLLPPAQPRLPGTSRGEDPESGFLRPVEGEVLNDGTPILSWRPIAGATSYRLEIKQIDGDYGWQEGADGASVRLPAEAALPARGRFLVLLEPVPADLTPLGGVSVSFRRAGLAATLGYRIQAAPLAVHLLGWLGLASLLLAAPIARRRRPSAA
ncbi:hypothetical protein KKG45_10390 [bacterium]|nr:hypothetical protein [bacterium]MBU1073645.1 hypothetical protein [bacterium]MBU1677059.1 hypothetical protein [bacterium]